VIPDGTPDPEVLQIAAAAGRVLVSRDVSTMHAHFEQFIAKHESPGLLLIPQEIDWRIDRRLLRVWLDWTPKDLRNLLRWLPWCLLTGQCFDATLTYSFNVC